MSVWSSVGAKVSNVSVAADLHVQAATRARGQVGCHERSGASEESKWRSCHPCHLDGDEIAQTAADTCQNRIHGIGAVLGRLPLTLIRTTEFLAVFLTFGEPRSGG